MLLDMAAPTTSVRFFELLLFGYAGFTSPDCTLCETCGDYLVAEHNGDVYACDFFVEPAWKLGNVRDGGLASFFASDRQREFGGRRPRSPVPSAGTIPVRAGAASRTRNAAAADP